MLTRHHWVDIFILRRQGPDGQKDSMMNSTATCSTLRGRGFVRLYLARESPYDENKQPYHTGSVAARVNKDRDEHRAPGRRCQVCYWCIIEDSLKGQHHRRYMGRKDRGVKYATGATPKIRGRDITIGIWNTRTPRAAWKL